MLIRKWGWSVRTRGKADVNVCRGNEQYEQNEQKICVQNQRSGFQEESENMSKMLGEAELTTEDIDLAAAISVTVVE